MSLSQKEEKRYTAMMAFYLNALSLHSVREAIERLVLSY
jgi:hypothetical protein